MKIEAGKTYVTKDGTKVGPMRARKADGSSNAWHYPFVGPWEGDATEMEYTEDGLYLIGEPNHILNLVAEFPSGTEFADAVEKELKKFDAMPATGEINTLLAERKSTHGEYIDHASFTWQIKEICHGSKNWLLMSTHQKETLDMIAHKIGRILAGDPHFNDHWQDISGYAKLTADRL